jgi:hypothetical protein
VNGTYNWSADDVPNSGEGTAVYNAVANATGAGQPANALVERHTPTIGKRHAKSLLDRATTAVDSQMT